MKLLCLFLLLSCVIACTSQSANDSIFPVPPTIDEETNNQDTNLSEHPPEPIIEPMLECLPEFQGEFITGKLDRSKSDYSRKSINTKVFEYYYILALEIEDSIRIQIVLPEATPGITPDLGEVINHGDILLVELDGVREPGIWDGVLVKNLTTNFSFR